MLLAVGGGEGVDVVAQHVPGANADDPSPYSSKVSFVFLTLFAALLGTGEERRRQEG